MTLEDRAAVLRNKLDALGRYDSRRVMEAVIVRALREAVNAKLDEAAGLLETWAVEAEGEPDADVLREAAVGVRSLKVEDADA